MKVKKKKTKNGKVHISARVDQSAIDNCRSIAEAKEWSFNQTIDKAMKVLKLSNLEDYAE